MQEYAQKTRLELKHPAHRHRLFLETDMHKIYPGFSGTWMCDICSRVSKSSAWHCEICQFDICKLCTESKHTECHNHALTPTCTENIYYGNGFKCDTCQSEIEEGISFHCNACMFDVCVECLENVKLPHVHPHMLQLSMLPTGACGSCFANSQFRYKCLKGCPFSVCILCVRGRDECGAPARLPMELLDEGDESDDTSEDDCVICMSRKRCVAAMHGKTVHMFACVQCANTVVKMNRVSNTPTKCPLCCAHVEKFVRIF